jgi:hypothetical protein
MSYDNLSCVSYNLLRFHQLFTGEERRIPFIFDDFHFCHSRVIGLDMAENRIFTCRMITWVVFLRMFWNFISSLPVKRGASLSFLTIFTFAVPELLDLIWRKIGFLYGRLETVRIMWLGMASGRPHRFPHNNFSSVYWIFTKHGHMIPLWMGKNPIYFGVIRSKVKVTITINRIFNNRVVSAR